MYTSTVFTKKPITFLNDGFGVVFPPVEGFKNLGILSNSKIFKNRTTHEDNYSYTFMTKTLSDIAMVISKELDIIAGASFSDNIIYRESTQWKKSIPVYDLNRYEAILQIRSEFNNLNEGTVLFGNYIDGISIRELVSAAKSFSKALK